MPAAREATIRARIPGKLKKETDAVFKAIGLSSSEAIRIFLAQVSLRRGLPFPVEMPGGEPDTTAELLSSKKNARRLRKAIAAPRDQHVKFDSMKELKDALGV